MQHFSWREKWQILLARLLIKSRRLTHDAYTITELNALLAGHFPRSMEVEVPVPVGRGELTLHKAEVHLDEQRQRIDVQILASLAISAVGNPLYRAHLNVIIAARPHYEAQTTKVMMQDIEVKDIYLIDDDYALLNDSTAVLDKLLPIPVAGLFATTLKGPFKGAISLLTAGVSEQALRYVRLYFDGNKQRVLDYHKPQLQQLVTELAEQEHFEYTMDQTDWQEYLFAKWGKRVVIENNELRFRFD
ncbi:DUF1439 domain-containing protein [Aestuariibacter salexigens]|uniref:DUF1439 domain-containing protein n=1 Tax=Aestuariibacter salexigens TaxID=226010 RepID=UPI00042A3A23|nr:DUF1439 domain-containing protein [Aestuariibacter salexigens]